MTLRQREADRRVNGRGRFYPLFGSHGADVAMRARGSIGRDPRLLVQRTSAAQKGRVIEWPASWEDVSRRSGADLDYCEGWENQLAVEVGPAHILFGKKLELIGRRFASDDALFLMPDGRVAEVHLTWRSSMEPDPRWPGSAIFESLDDWVRHAMKFWD